LLSTPERLTEALASGATIVVPSRQRAAAVRLASSAAAFRQGLSLWRTPDVLPWPSWLSRELQAARSLLPGGRRLLRPTESWILWRAIAQELAGERELLCTSGLAAALPRSLALAADWGLHWSGDPTPEAELLGAARASWQRRCRALEALDGSDWSLLAAAARPGDIPPLAFAGFASLGTARAAWLRARGVRCLDTPGESSAETLMHAAPDAAAELAAAAAWCRERLRADPEARLLVIVPGLDRLRSRVLRGFGRALHPADALAARASVFAIEGGQPLAEFPLVRAALSLLAFGQRSLPFAEFAALLRTPYLALGAPPGAARLELWLRDLGVTTVDPARLRGLQAAVARELGAAAAGVVQRLLDGLPGATAADTAGTWARRHAARLELAGWPGSATLDSDELQVRRRFEELLGDYALADGSLARHGGVEALQLLEALAHDSAFEPATDDVPVTLSTRLEDPVVRYDGIWVCGCDATRWPAPPAPDAFIPVSVQLAAGVPAASAAGQLELARRTLAAWRAATPELVLSYAASEEDAEQAPSGLLHGLRAWQPAGPAQVAVAAAPLESLRDVAGPAWRGGRRVRGGVRALELQAECPFRAFAELRLEAAPVPEPAAGIDPRLRGRVLHGALERLWRELGDSAALCALPAAAREERVRAAVSAAMAAELSGPGVAPPAMLVHAEQQRAAAVIGALLEAERERAPFRVVETEAQRPLALGEYELRVRLDRVDRLADGRVAIVDYKAGRAEGFDAQAERLRRPQLPCYALAWGEEVAAVATVHLRRDGVKWRGAADADGRLPGLRGAGADWPQLLAHWRAGLGALLEEFTSGGAAVAPLPGACERCHLAGLCRIDVPRLGADDSGDADGP
jgi:probable DNA repair protein